MRKWKQFLVFTILSFSVLDCWTNPLWKDALDPSKKSNKNGALAAILALLSHGSATIKISNAIDEGTIESGFLVGTASSNAQKVMISLDGGAPQPATGTTNWSYKLPTGSNTWAYYTQHKIAAYATDSSGNPLGAQLITVRKGRNKDIDGDGAADLVVGNGGGSGLLQGVLPNTIYIFYSSQLSQSSLTTADAKTRITADSASFSLQSAPVLEDMNSDGFADIFLFVLNGNSTELFGFLSQGSSGISSYQYPTTNSPSVTLSCSSCQGNLVSGDFNSDGYPDLAVPYNPGSESLLLFLSSNSQPISGSTGQTNISFPGITSYPIMASGKVTSQGADLVAVGPKDSKAELLAGGSSVANSTFKSPVTNCSGFSASFPVTITDLNSDGSEDLVFANINNNGKIYRFFSNGQGSFNPSQCSSSWLTWSYSNSIIMNSVSGDFDGDGLSDLSFSQVAYNFGAQNPQPPPQGEVRLYLTNGSSLTSVSSYLSIFGVSASDSIPKGFGMTIGSGDFNGDGITDISIGAPAYGCSSASDTNYNGQVYLFWGNSGSVSYTNTLDASTYISSSKSENFGDILPGMTNYASSFMGTACGAPG